MKSSEVLKILGISRVTLSNYVKSNKIKVLNSIMVFMIMTIMMF